MYKDIKDMLEDKKILEELIKGLEDTIKYKIENELGLHSTTFSELKVETMGVIEDKFARVFAKLESLDKKRETRQGELDIINRRLNNLDNLIGQMSDKKKKVFRCRYIWGMPIKSIAERLNYSEIQVKRILKEINKK